LTNSFVKRIKEKGEGKEVESQWPKTQVRDTATEKSENALRFRIPNQGTGPSEIRELVGSSTKRPLAGPSRAYDVRSRLQSQLGSGDYPPVPAAELIS
jgi:hypothetical protein